MDLGRISHVNYAFFDVKPNCKVESGDPFATTEKKNAEVGQTWSGDGENLPGGTMGAFRIMRDGSSEIAKQNGHYYPHIKLLLSLGGWTWSVSFSACTRDAAKRRIFVESAVDVMIEHDLDGLDFDWEYPTGCFPEEGGVVNCGLAGNTWDPNDWADYVSLLKEIRAEINARGLTPCLDNASDQKCKYITTAAGMSPVLNGSPQAKSSIKNWVDQQDFVNLMTYDFHGAWQNVSAHHTALHPLKDLDSSVPDNFDIEQTFQVLVDLGLPVNKMTIGLAAYGRGWGDTTAADYKKQSACTGATCPLKPGTWEPGVYSWWDIKANYLGNGDWTRHWDDDAKAPYIASDSKKGLIVYDDPESIQIKVQWAKSKGFGGFMWWESSDDPFFELHQAAIDAWNGKMYANSHNGSTYLRHRRSSQS